MDFLCDTCNNADAKLLRIRSLGHMANPFINFTFDTCIIHSWLRYSSLPQRNKKGPMAQETSKIVTHGQTRQGTMWGGCGPWEVTSEHSPPYEKLHLAVYETAFGSVWDCLRQCMRLPSAVYESIDWAYRNSCNSFDINPLADLQRTFFTSRAAA